MTKKASNQYSVMDKTKKKKTKYFHIFRLETTKVQKLRKY